MVELRATVVLLPLVKALLLTEALMTELLRALSTEEPFAMELESVVKGEPLLDVGEENTPEAPFMTLMFDNAATAGLQK